MPPHSTKEPLRVIIRIEGFRNRIDDSKRKDC